MPLFTAGQRLRASALNDATEGTAPVAITFVTANFGNFGAGWSGVRVWKQGNTVFMGGMAMTLTARAAATEQLGTVPVGYRPTNGSATGLAGPGGGTVCRLDVGTNGVVNLAHDLAIASGTFIIINMSWSLV